MAGESEYNLVRERVDDLFRLNPDMPETERTELYRAASGVDSARFAEFAEKAQALIAAYLRSPHKHTEKEILGEYFAYLERSTKLLVASGDISEDAAESEEPNRSTALVHRHFYSSLDWCKVLSKAALPKGLVLAVDSCKRRNSLVRSVVEDMLVVLQQIDGEAAFAWTLAYLEENRGCLDPDIVRDVLNAWLRCDELPKAVLDWAALWSSDENLQRQWPAVVQRADRLLREHTLRLWRREFNRKAAALKHLDFIIAHHLHDQERLLRWLESALLRMGESVDFFVSAYEEGGAGTDADPDDEWRSAALLREVRTIESLFPPVLALADLIMQIPEGAHHFALAFFGLVGRGYTRWETDLLKLAERSVRRAFLRGLRRDTPPEQLIRKLTFGDQQMYLRMMGELDFLTKDFDSLKQREKVVKQLAVYYASYREPELMGIEITKRYRNLMRLGHEDNLRRVLTPEQFEEIHALDILRDVTALASDARRFIARRRALKTSVEEMVSAELDFERSIRRRRLFLLQKRLFAKTE